METKRRFPRDSNLGPWGLIELSDYWAVSRATAYRWITAPMSLAHLHNVGGKRPYATHVSSADAVVARAEAWRAEARKRQERNLWRGRPTDTSSGSVR